MSEPRRSTHKGSTPLIPTMRAGILVPPQNFGLVEDGLYRSGQPTELSYPFLEQLQLRTILHLSADEPPAEFASWASEQRIQLVRLGAGADANMLSPWKPVSEVSALAVTPSLLAAATTTSAALATGADSCHSFE